MNIRQKIMKFLYPLIMKVSKMAKVSIIANEKNMAPTVSFYNLIATTNKNESFSFENLKGKNVLIVNTASNCGFTQQYEELEKLHQSYTHNLVIIGFPANDFKQQEKGSDTEIAEFCKINYGVHFPIMQKSVVVKNEQQNKIYTWLSDALQNGWNNQAPTWNFSKYLINKQGVLTHYFAPSVSPLSSEIVESLK
jgi:glutathione peroxidase